MVEDGVEGRNFAIKVKILQAVVMTRNFFTTIRRKTLYHTG